MFSGHQLKTARLSKGITQSELGGLLHVNKMTISNWEKGKNIPNEKHLNALLHLFNVTSDYFDPNYKLLTPYNQLTISNKEKVIGYSERLLNHQIDKKSKDLIDKPSQLYAYRVYESLSAGTGYSYFGDGNFDVVFYDEQLEYDFASWVFGDSMEPTYLNGEVVLIKQNSFDYDGAIYAVEWDGQTYIKKVFREDEGLRLVSLNKNILISLLPIAKNLALLAKLSLILGP
ncbi:peptidase S24-like protein [Streptococcus pyogenes GA41039]|nr:peptidase S24-like protein [Streptococcus pyogenes GA41039]